MALSFKNIYLNDRDKFLDKMLTVQKYSEFQLAAANIIWIQSSKSDNVTRAGDDSKPPPLLSPFSPLYSVHGRCVAGRVPQFRHRFCLHLLALSHYHYCS